MLASAPAPLLLSAQERTIPLTADGYLRILAGAGTVKVSGWTNDSVRVVGRLAPGQQLFGGGSARMVKVGVEGPDVPATLQVWVPQGAKVVVEAGASSVDLDGVTGPVEIRGTSGVVNVLGAPVRLTIETVDGAVTLTGGPFRSTEVRTAGGTIRVAGARGELMLSSVAGAIFADADSVTRGNVTTVSGVIRFTGAVDRTGTLTVESHGGDIQLGLDPRSGVEVVATAFGGTIENTLTTTAPRVVREGRSQIIETAIGGGGGTVTVTSFKGRVRIGPR
jgi:hypothetical protein